MAGIQCDPYESLYVKTEQIVCKVDGPGTKEPRRGPVIVKVADFRGESRDNYEFVDPQIRAIRPKKGPQAGKNTSLKCISYIRGLSKYIHGSVSPPSCVYILPI